MTSGKSAVLRVRWNINSLAKFINVLQNPKIYSIGSWPFNFLSLPAMSELLIGRCFSDVLPIWASDSSILSKSDINSPSLLVKT